MVSFHSLIPFSGHRLTPLTGVQVPGAEKYFIRSLERYLRSPLRLEPEPFCFIQVGGVWVWGGGLGL